MPNATFKTGLKVAREETATVAPAGSTNAHWFQGGLWLPITTDGLPDLLDRQAIIFPAGQAGRRAINNRAPVKGRRWSDGSFGFQVTSDFIVSLLHGACGSLTTTPTCSTDHSLTTTEWGLVAATSNQQDLDVQPSDGGAVLRFTVTETSAAGWISVSGVTADGLGASEVISFSSAGIFYTRNSFSSVGASSIVIYSDNAASCTVDGFSYWTHTIAMDNTSNPTYSIERQGDPTVNASAARVHTGMVVQELTLNADAEARDGIFNGDVTWEGYPTATCDATSLMSTSTIRIIPGWTTSATRDGSPWSKVTTMSVTINSGNRNYRSAAGIDIPQGQAFLGQEVTGAFQLLVDDEAEFDRWRGTSAQQLVFNWDTPWKLTSTINEKVTASALSAYLENVSVADADGLFVLDADWRTIDNADAGLIKFEVINGLPGTAYGNPIT